MDPSLFPIILLPKFVSHAWSIMVQYIYPASTPTPFQSCLTHLHSEHSAPTPTHPCNCAAPTIELLLDHSAWLWRKFPHFRTERLYPYCIWPMVSLLAMMDNCNSFPFHCFCHIACTTYVCIADLHRMRRQDSSHFYTILQQRPIPFSALW